MLAALFRKAFNVQDEEDTPYGEWVVRFRGQDGSIEQLGVYTGDKEEALACGQAWFALRYQHVEGAPAGYLELRKRSSVRGG